MHSWIRSKAKSPKPTVTWCASPVPRPPSSPCISNGTYKNNPGLPFPSIRSMSLRRNTPTGQTGRGLRGVLMSTGQEIVQDGLNESLKALGGYDQVFRRTTDAFNKASKWTLKRKAGEALTKSKRKVRDLFG